ncbi:type IV secretory system conjugative DNA transfer family protein [Arthrobacter sp. ISL-72]|uniref:type IV secretory system conjugative DNA transfer family protein n=1 Tax=Arthrobacter sp. ISL-72 TaxID=2819114 RepID=UPI001BE97546|nr:TraM recognition domain-containing protein [Arthrobacter sp. ISL-72]MBT2594046.1 type IV secretory system conjugative DNA transfer family protein [Arthrobacter sp. ISL-72]
MSAPNRKGTGLDDALEIWLAIGSAAVIGGGSWVSAHLGSWLAGIAAPPAHPIYLIAGLVKGKVPWPVQSTVVAAVMATLLLAGVILVLVIRAKGASKRARVDKAARYLGRGKSLAAFSEPGAKATAERLGVTGSPGIPVGRVVSTGQKFIQPWEDLSIDIWGPRTGKSTSRVIPAILDAPGAVVSTSNKRDVVDGTRSVRAGVAPVWVFDPQKIAQEEPSWWWNPLSYVTDEEKAYKLTQHFAAGSRTPGSKPDAYFDPKAEDILSSYFLAAALGELPITQVYLWVTEQVSRTPIEILKEHGYELQYKGLESTLKLADKQRDGIFGTAEKMVQCLKSRNTLRWVAPEAGATVATDPRRQFNPNDFAHSRETIYILSKEGAGSAAPLTTALTVAMAEAMEERAERRGGRLDLPALFALDELANVVRWAGLPDQFSHYGSKGLIVMAILQSWSQGVELWGEANMRKIWSAANIKVYGGGVAEDGFLRALSDLIGDYSYTNVSISSGKSGRSRSRQEGKERIFDVSNLAELDRGRAVVLASGAPATLVRTLPWYTGPHKEAVEASIKANSPSREDDDALVPAGEAAVANPWIAT